MRMALVDAQGRVVNVVMAEDEGFTPADAALKAVPCGDAPVAEGWRLDEASDFAPPPFVDIAAEPVAVIRKVRLLEALDGMKAREDWERMVAAAKQTTRDYWACEPRIARGNPKMLRVARRCDIDWEKLVDAAASL